MNRNHYSHIDTAFKQLSFVLKLSDYLKENPRHCVSMKQDYNTSKSLLNF